jgi:hypothetical protein
VSERGIEAEGIDVLPILKDYDYVKMDIEGSEWPILSDPRWVEAMREVSVFVIEWHAQEGVAGDHRAAAVTAVRRAGFAPARMESRAHLGVWRSASSGLN